MWPWSAAAWVVDSAAGWCCWVGVDSEDRVAWASVASGARVSSSVFRGLLSLWSGLGSSAMIDAYSGIQAFVPSDGTGFGNNQRSGGGCWSVVLFPKQLRLAGANYSLAE